MVSLNEVVNELEFNAILRKYSRDELLLNKLKFIISPINAPIPIPAKRPKQAETVGSYFGMDNVDLYHYSDDKIESVSILVNIYSKWIIRKFLPFVTAALGRMCDFIMLSSDDKTIFADFRLLSTTKSRDLINKALGGPPIQD